MCPTVQGYRFFVDSLLKVAPINHGEMSICARRLEIKGERESLMDAATSLISEVTHMAGIVTLPKQERLILRHVEFLALSPERVLVILVVNGSDVQNRVIHLGRPYSQACVAAGRQLPERRSVRGQGSAGGPRGRCSLSSRSTDPA